MCENPNIGIRNDQYWNMGMKNGQYRTIGNREHPKTEFVCVSGLFTLKLQNRAFMNLLSINISYAHTYKLTLSLYQKDNKESRKKYNYVDSEFRSWLFP